MVDGKQFNFRHAQDLLSAVLPPFPIVYDADALIGTKDTTESELGVKEKLEVVVYYPEIFARLMKQAEQLLKPLRFNAAEIHDHNLFGAHAIPHTAASLAPRVINSETDVVTWCQMMIFKPALAVLRCLPSGDLGFYNEPRVPHVASATQRKIIPDATLIIREGDKGDDPAQLHIGAVMEVKAPPAMLKAKFSALMEPGKAVIRSHLRTMRFLWPSDPSQTKDDHQTRMFIQIWAQMASRLTPDKPGIGVLTCGKLQVFFVKDGRSLIMSKWYTLDARPLLATFMMFAVASGHIDIEDAHLKDVRERINVGKKLWTDEVKSARPDHGRVGVYPRPS
ncbi:hypothetical protein C8T65DRAFT_737648 [Cerioporus squamosus]|nr:hypothetical protein C8T65DRAFT_737648 [Cerioporus squamosus]